VNRRDLQSLSNLRLREAQVLFRARQFSGAYYLAGYSVECALKACIARQFRRYEFPDKKIVNKVWTHDLRDLTVAAGLQEARLKQAGSDPAFRRNWDLSMEWSEDSRYRTTDRTLCAALTDAKMEENHGLLPWIKQRW
jgi:hypothetical protein